MPDETLYPATGEMASNRIPKWPTGPEYVAQVEGIRNAVPDAWV
jgi:hypothetical protein